MPHLPDELFGQIAARTGEMSRLLATYRDVLSQLEALNAHALPSIQVTVHGAGKHYSMRVLVQVLRAQHEADIAILARRIREAAATPMDWMPMEVVAPEPPPASPEYTPPTEGDVHHG